MATMFEPLPEMRITMLRMTRIIPMAVDAPVFGAKSHARAKTKTMRPTPGARQGDQP
jgi:hypothetical protein